MRRPTFYDSAAWRNLVLLDYGTLVKLGESHQEAARRLVREARRHGFSYKQDDVVRALNELMLDWNREQSEGGEGSGGWTWQQEAEGREAYERGSDSEFDSGRK